MPDIPRPTAEDLAAVAELTRQLRSQRRLTPGERSALWQARRQQAVTAMLENPGLAYGQVTGSPGAVSSSPDLEEFRRALREVDGDLTAQIRIVSEGVQSYFETGEFPASYYAWRVGVLLRKVGRYDLEADFLEAFTVLFGDGNGARYDEIAERAAKARKLASRT